MGSGYVSHLRADGSYGTVCGEPWQGWQEPDMPSHGAPVLPPFDLPRSHHATGIGDEIRFCGACQKRVREGRP